MMFMPIKRKINLNISRAFSVCSSVGALNIARSCSTPSERFIVDTLVLKLAESGEIANMNALDIKNYILQQLSPAKQENSKERLFAERFLKFAQSKKESTQLVYMNTYKKMGQFCDDLDKLTLLSHWFGNSRTCSDIKAVLDFLFIAIFSGAGFPSLTALVSRYSFVLAIQLFCRCFAVPFQQK